MKHITPEHAADALLTTLRLAEMYQKWDLFAAVLEYLREAKADFHYAGPQQYVITFPPPSKG